MEAQNAAGHSGPCDARKWSGSRQNWLNASASRRDWHGDNHLKNWSFIFPGPGEVRLSPAYDIVPTVLYIRNDALALRFAGVQRFERVRLHQFRRLASLLKVDPDWIEKGVRRLVAQALQTWPEQMAQLPLSGEQRQRLLARWDTLDLVEEVRSGGFMGPGPEHGGR